MRRVVTRFAVALCLALASASSAQTWIGPGADWNTAADWFPAIVPNSPTATPSFTGTDVGAVNISASVQSQSLLFTNSSGAYTLTSNAGVTLSGLTGVVVGTAVTGPETINLASLAAGSLVFTGAPTVTNLSTSSATTLVIGPSTVIGAANHAGLTFAGSGVTQISGAFASSTNTVTGGLVKSGPGTLILGGNGASLTGVLALSGGTLQLDYSSNTLVKLGAGGSLNLGGGRLALVANTSTPITQTIAGGTVVSAGHTDVVASSAGGGTITLGLGGIGRLAGATLDVSTAAGAPAFSATTSTGNTNGLLGTGPAFATVGGGATWATASGGAIAGLSAADYTPDDFITKANVDVTASAAPKAFTANSLRFNATPATTLTLTGLNTLQSGGILVTPSASGGGTITGGQLIAPTNGELFVHQYGGSSTFTINSALISAVGLTKTGPGTLALGGDNTFGGPLNVNRGSLTVTNAAAVNSASAINFNDDRTGNSLQTLRVDLGNNTAGTISPPIRLSAFANADALQFGTVFTTSASVGSRVTLSGALSSAPGLTTPIRFTGAASNTSGFNLTNVGNTFLGDVTLFQGTLGITAEGCLGDAGNTLILDTFDATVGGLEFLNSGITVSRPIVVHSSSRVASNGSDTNAIAGPVSSSAGIRPLVKAGTGTLVFSGNGSTLLGGLTLGGGTLKLDYSTNTALKLGGGALTLNGGVLSLVANTSTPVTQNVPAGTAVAAGHTDLLATSAGGGSITLGLAAITRSAGATLDFPATGPTFTATTSAGNTTGLLGTGPAFATFKGGTTWATASGAGPTFTVAGLASYDVNNFTATSNLDVTPNTVGSGGATVNSLRFNTGTPALILNGTLTVQSGGILVTPTGGGQIAGVGTVTAPGGGEILVHHYSAGQFAITAPIASSAGLTKTGPGSLFLSGNNTALTGPVNVNRGSLIVSGGTAPVNSASAINFNDARGGADLQTFTVALSSGQNGTITPPIRVSAFAAGAAAGTVFSTGSTISNSRIALAGVISSAPGLTTPIRFTGNADDSSGFNLTAANTFTGDVTVADGTLGIVADASLGNPANDLILQVSNTAAGGLEFLNGGVTVARAVSVNGTRIVSNGTDSNAISGPVSGSGGFVKAGTGTLTLTNSSNSVTGGVTVQAGTLSLGTQGLLPSGTSTSVTVNAGAVFNPPTARIQTVGTVTLNGGTFRMPGGSDTTTIVNQIVTDSNGGTVDYSATIGGNALLLVGASPAITIAGNSTWLGSTTGSTRLSMSNTADTPIAISPGVTFTNGLALATSSSFGYRVSGGGTLFQNANPASAALANARLTVVRSRFRVTDASSNGGVGNLGTGTFTLDGSVFAYGGVSAATGKPITLAAGGGTIDVESAAATLTASGVISGPGALMKIGPGTLTLANSGNSFTGLTINVGAIETADDAALGSNPVITGAAGGTLSYTGTTSSARTFNLNAGTLLAASAATVTFNGATVNGGFIRGPGAFVLTGQTALNGVSTTSSAAINQTGPASVVNFTNGGQFINALGQTLALNNGVNASAGRLTVNGIANVRDFVSDGQVTVGGGGLVDNSSSSSSIVLGGGSRTTINAGGSINAGSTSIEVSGALLVNNGTVTGTTNVHFNGEAVGTGTYGPVNLFENGRFAPGASASPAVFSPGVVAASQASFGPQTTLEVQIGGKTPGVNQDQLAVAAAANLGGTLAISNAPSFVSPNLYHYKVMSFASRSGIFTTYTGTSAGNGLLYAPIYTDTDLTLIATLPGDATVDGSVDFNDLVALAQNYNTDISATTDNGWRHGDFTYDGKVDFNDLVLVAQHYNTSITPAPADLPASLATDWPAALAAANAPEPSACGMLILIAICATSRSVKAHR